MNLKNKVNKRSIGSQFFRFLQVKIVSLYEMSRKKKLNKIIRNKPQYSVTLKQLIDQGRLPKYFHLFDHVEIEEYEKQFRTDWWKRMSTPGVVK